MPSYDKIIRLLAVLAIFTFALGFYTYASGITPEAPLEAQWVPNAVKITFDSNGGGVAPGAQIYTFGIERSLPGVGNMIKSGYHVVGWAETSSAASPKWPLGAISNDAFGYADATKAIAKTLYAVWQPDTTTSALVETLSSLESRLAAVESNTSSIKNTVNTMSTSGGGVVKSVQRGITSELWAGSHENITINAVDTSKSIIILDPVSMGYADSGAARHIVSWKASFNSTTSISIGSNFYNNGNWVSGNSYFKFKVGWQVIEFY